MKVINESFYRDVFLPDCFSANELITYEALGLCDEGKSDRLAVTLIGVPPF